ncbi:MAG: type II/IV secretion system protein, partial [Verrucomicrobiota bacterium]
MKSQPLVDLLRASGVDDLETARALAALCAPGGAWVHEVLNSGKVDETRFTEALGALFDTPVEPLSAARLDRSALAALPSRFVFKHHILPLAVEEATIRLATCDVFNATARQLAAQLVGGRTIAWALVPRSQLLRAIKSAYGVGAETFEELLQNSRALDAADQEGAATDLNAADPEASVVSFVNQV